jgi:hypothetical protein
MVSFSVVTEKYFYCVWGADLCCPSQCGFVPTGIDRRNLGPAIEETINYIWCKTKVGGDYRDTYCFYVLG